MFTIHWAQCCRGQAGASNLWLGSPMLAIDSWDFESFPIDMLPTDFKPNRIEPWNSEPANVRTEPNRITSFDSNWGVPGRAFPWRGAYVDAEIEACQTPSPGKSFKMTHAVHPAPDHSGAAAVNPGGFARIVRMACRLPADLEARGCLIN